MTREPRRIRPRSLASSEKRRTIKDVTALPKGSKEMLRKGGKGKGRESFSTAFEEIWPGRDLKCKRPYNLIYIEMD